MYARIISEVANHLVLKSVKFSTAVLDTSTADLSASPKFSRIHFLIWIVLIKIKITDMKLFKTIGSAIFFLIIYGGLTSAQPIPVELMLGNKYGTVNVVFSKAFSQTSRFGFFHVNTVQFGYSNKQYNDFILQDLAYVETFKNLRVTGGVVYSAGGFNTTAGIQYIYNTKKLLVLLSPRVNIESNPSYDIMTIVQYKPDLNEKVKLYTRLQMLNLFSKEGNMKSYQWMRLGLEVKGVQFGLAVNIDELGPKPSAKSSFGLFFRKELF